MNILKYNFQFPSSMIFLGRSTCGKTTLMKNLLFKYVKEFNRIFVFCPIYNNDYDFMEDKYIIRDVEVLKTLIETQYNLRKVNRQKKILIILEDFAGSLKIDRHTEFINKLISNGRHADISVFFLTQFITQVTPMIRNNLNYLLTLNVCIDSCDKLSCYQDLYSKTEFRSFYKNITSTQYNGVLIDSKAPYLKDKNGKKINVIAFYFEKLKSQPFIKQG